MISFVPIGALTRRTKRSTTLRYFIRGRVELRARPGGLIAGLFGRKPQPVIQQSYLIPNKPLVEMVGSVKTQIGIVLKNLGLGIAEDLFENLKVASHPGLRCEIAFDIAKEPEVWWGRYALAQEVHVIARPGYLLPPEALVKRAYCGK